MRDGRIEQIDAPRDLYRRPRSLFVASFLGQANLVPARVAGGVARGVAGGVTGGVADRGGEHLVVDTPLGRFRVAAGGEGCGQDAGGADPVPAAAAAPAGTAPPPRDAGAPLTLFFRPEGCELRQSGNPREGGRKGPNRVRALIRRIEYLGSRQLLEVEAAGLRLTLDLPGRDSFAVGEAVCFGVPPERCCLLER